MTDFELLLTVVSLTVFVCCIIAASGFYLFWRYVSKKTSEKISEKSSESLSDLRKRVAVYRLLENGDLDDVIFATEEIEDVIRTQSELFLERQAKKFLECALNLMAHSYSSLDEAKNVALEMIELSFESDLVIDEGDIGDQNVSFG